MGALTHAALTAKDDAMLLNHLRKHKTYPYSFRIKKTINAATFTRADAAGGGSFFTFTFRPNNYVGIISIAANMILRPNTTIGRFAYVVSYNNALTFADNPTLTAQATEAQEVYQLATNGGAVNDYQVFYPLDWFVEKGSPLYIHVWADSINVAAGASTLEGWVTFGTLISGQQ